MSDPSMRRLIYERDHWRERAGILERDLFESMRERNRLRIEVDELASLLDSTRVVTGYLVMDGQRVEVAS